MALTYIIASRSKDPSTQVGAIVVDSDHRPLGIGYNGIPQAMSDKDINWKRPDKYVYIEHAEINALDHAGLGIGLHALRGCVIYVSAMPCPNCMRKIAKYRLKQVIYGKTAVNMLGEELIAQSREMARLGNVSLEPHKGNLNWIRDRIDWLETNLSEVF
jgi:dCMP deaminase